MIDPTQSGDISSTLGNIVNDHRTLDLRGVSRPEGGFYAGAYQPVIPQ